MRAYFFGNYYLSQIQQGIQAAHVVGELFSKYSSPSVDASMMVPLYNWADTEKTIILLNGGNSARLQQHLEFFQTGNAYPFAHFNEDQVSLNNALTCVGIVLPPNIYEAAEFIRNGGEVSSPNPMTGKIIADGKYMLSLWDLELIGILNSCRLA